MDTFRKVETMTLTADTPTLARAPRAVLVFNWGSAKTCRRPAIGTGSGRREHDCGTTVVGAWPRRRRTRIVAASVGHLRYDRAVHGAVGASPIEGLPVERVRCDLQCVSKKGFDGHSCARLPSLVDPACGYYLLACALSSTAWLPLLLWERHLLAHRPSQYWHLAGGVGPAVAAIFVSGRYGGRDELRRLLRRAADWRVPAIWHAIAWLSPLVLFGVAATALTRAASCGPPRHSAGAWSTRISPSWRTGSRASHSTASARSWAGAALRCRGFRQRAARLEPRWS